MGRILVRDEPGNGLMAEVAAIEVRPGIWRAGRGTPPPPPRLLVGARRPLTPPPHTAPPSHAPPPRPHAHWWQGEKLLHKPGKGAFYTTDLQEWLQARGVTHLLFAGVTTEVCVQTRMREANDRGYECLLVTDATGARPP